MELTLSSAPNCISLSSWIPLVIIPLGTNFHYNYKGYFYLFYLLIDWWMRGTQAYNLQELAFWDQELVHVSPKKRLGGKCWLKLYNILLRAENIEYSKYYHLHFLMYNFEENRIFQK